MLIRDRGIRTPSKRGIARVFAGITSQDRHGCTQKMRGEVTTAQKKVERNFLKIVRWVLKEEAMAKPKVAPQES